MDNDPDSHTSIDQEAQTFDRQRIARIVKKGVRDYFAPIHVVWALLRRSVHPIAWRKSSSSVKQRHKP
jgi:hypothetical protein